MAASLHPDIPLHLTRFFPMYHMYGDSNGKAKRSLEGEESGIRMAAICLCWKYVTGNKHENMHILLWNKGVLL